MGGEKQVTGFASDNAEGSPPHGRGKVYLGPQLWAGHRITPAWAGKSFAGCILISASRDHPRVGGEKFSHALPLLGGVGSPPRGRGKARHLSHGLLPCG